MIRTQDLLSQQISCITESSINYVDHIITLQYIPSTYLSCNWKYVPFDCLQPIPPPPSPASSKHKSDLFSYEFICFENIIDLQHYISFCYIQYFCTIQNDHHDKSGYHTKLLHNYWLYSSNCIFHTCSIYFAAGSLYLLISLIYFSPLQLSPLWQPTTCLFSVSMIISLLLCLFLCFVF